MSREKTQEILLKKKSLVARFKRVTKIAARFRIMRTLTGRGVAPAYLPSLDRMKIVFDDLRFLRESFFSMDRVYDADGVALFVVPFWWRKQGKNAGNFEQSAALVGIDCATETFVVPPSEYADLFDVSDWERDGVSEEITSVRYLGGQEMTKGNEDVEKSETKREDTAPLFGRA